ncbi:Late embryogenesis abundant protein [Theobroma cacao]|nr:Late embryogenesis abundant protein [Theobroma cacao]
MEKKQEHVDNKADRKEEKKESLEGLPVKNSPYVKHKDLEDYKRQGYGTEGHLQPKPGRGAASSTDATTLSGANLSSERDIAATDTINRQGFP